MPKIYLPSAIAVNGDKQEITVTQDPDIPQRCSFDKGVPAICSAAKQNGGKPMRREDFNWMLYALSNDIYELQRGIQYTFNSNVSGGYPMGAVLWYPAGGYFVKSLVDNNTQSYLADTTKWERISGGSGKSMGEVFYSQSALAADNPGSLPLFTGETISNADQLYPAFYNWVRTHSDLHISAADYETAITNYGECPKYVIDTTNKTIRLPLLKTFIKMAQLGPGEDIKQGEAGLPNITGELDFTGKGSIVGGANYPTGSGALKVKTETSTGITAAVMTATVATAYELDASESNAIYGNSNTVTPQYTTLYPWVFVYSAAVAASVAQAAEFQAALSGKVDLASGVAQADVDYVIESYVYGTSWYRIYKSGWCEQGGQTNIASGSGNFSLAFLQEFTDTNYNFLCQPEITDTSTTYADRLGVYRIIGAVYSKATTGVQIQYDSSTFTGKFFWRAEGYLAS